MAKTIHSILTFVIVLIGLFTSPFVASQTARVCVFPSVMAEDGVCYQSEGVKPISVKILKKGIVERVKPDCVSIRETPWSLYETKTCTWQQTVIGSDEGSPPLVGAGGSETTTGLILGRVLIPIGILFMSISLLASLFGNSKSSAVLAGLAALFVFIPVQGGTGTSSTVIWASALGVGAVMSALFGVLTANYKKSTYKGEKTQFFSSGALYLLMAPVVWWLM